MTSTVPPQVLYFGKLPCRGDFVRSASHPALIQSLDHWLSAGIELLAEDAHWKAIYDRADAAHFAMLSTHRHSAVAGHIVPSADTSGRRFPFLTACTIESGVGAEFMGLAPLLLRATWSRFASATARARAAADTEAPEALAELGHVEWPGLPATEQVRSEYHDFLEQTTLGEFTQELGDTGAALDVRQNILALGLLLQPVMNSAGQSIDKGLCLPLPQDPARQALVATWWMDLMSRFLTRSSHDLTLFLPQGQNHRPCLMVGFSAGAASVLQGLLDPRMTDSVFLRLDESPWVEAYVDNDYALKKLSSYLQLPQMSLAQVLSTFQESFLGN